MAEIAIAGVVVSGVVPFVAPLFVKFVQRKINERKESLSDIHEVLQEGLEELLALQECKEREVSINCEKKVPSDPYKNWKKRVLKIQVDVTSLNRDYEEVGRDPQSQVEKEIKKKEKKVEKEIKKAVKNVIELFKKCPKIVLVDKLPAPVIEEINVPEIWEYPRLNDALRQIQNLLRSQRVKCVALFGQKGTGKTTIMKHLNNYYFSYFGVDKKFEMVIFINVAADVQTDAQTEESHILQKIAERIMVGGNGDELVRQIRRGLGNKIYLLILDGVRYAYALHRILENLHFSSRSDSKVVISTHYHLASSLKHVDCRVNLKMLSSVEACDMFQKIAGKKNLEKPKVQLICKRLCSNLPLLICPIANSFACNEAPLCWETLMHWPKCEVEGIDELFSILKICYDGLGPGKQDIFLYAALYPANSRIYTDYFVECCIAQRFLEDVIGAASLTIPHSQGIEKTLKHLVNVSFLEGSGEEMMYVKMNDFYRQLALHISSQDQRPRYEIYVDNEKHKEDSRFGSWERARWVSMVDSKAESLPANPNFPNLRSLQTLLLEKSPRLVEIPTLYFCTIDNLLVLNLNGTLIRSLPSLERLTVLKAFYLKGCSNLIIDSDNIRKLEKLEVFDSRGTRVNFVPNLEHLRCLRILYSPTVDVVEISRLHNLEELIIEVEEQFLPQFLPQWDNVFHHIGGNDGSGKINVMLKLV